MKTKFMKVLSTLLAMALLATTGIGTLAAYQVAVPENLVGVAEDVVMVSAGDTVSVSIVAKEDLALNGFDGKWGWAEGLSFTGMTSSVMELPAEAGKDQQIDGNYWTADGELIWVDTDFPNTNATAGTQVLTANFATDENLKAGNYRVTFQLEVLGDDMTLFDGEYTLEWSVHVHNDLDNDHMCDADNCDEKLSEHDFSNGDCPCGEKKPGLKGDVDLDGDVDMDDVVALMSHVLSDVIITDPTALGNGEVTNDTTLNMDDVVKLMRYVLSDITTLE